MFKTFSTTFFALNFFAAFNAGATSEIKSNLIVHYFDHYRTEKVFKIFMGHEFLSKLKTHHFQCSFKNDQESMGFSFHIHSTFEELFNVKAGIINDKSKLLSETEIDTLSYEHANLRVSLRNLSHESRKESSLTLQNAQFSWYREVLDRLPVAPMIVAPADNQTPHEFGCWWFNPQEVQ